MVSVTGTRCPGWEIEEVECSGSGTLSGPGGAGRTEEEIGRPGPVQEGSGR